MHDVDWPTAIANLLEYCRDPRRTLSTGRALEPVLLPSGDLSARLSKDWAMAAALKGLIEREISRLRAQAKIVAPVSDSPGEHLRALRQDIGVSHGRGDLKFWSLLWAYYICALSHEQIADACDWSVRLNQLRVKEAREVYLLHKLYELAYRQRRD